VLPEGTRWSELAELVTDHVFRHIDGNEGLAIMDFQIETDEIRGDRRATGPGLDRFTAVGLLGHHNLVEDMRVDEETFFTRACHVLG